MAKLRVYELARELNMTNKELLDKLQELEIEVKSHMSSLEDTTVTTIRNALFGRNEQTKVVEDTRVKPNIIRRRRKRVAEAQTAEEATEASEIATEAAETPEAEPDVAAAEAAPPSEETAPSAEEVPEEEPAEMAATAEEAEAPAEAPSADVEAPAEKTEATSAEPLKTEAETAAKIVKPAETEVAPVKAEVEQAEAAGETEATAEPEPTSEPVEPEISASAEAEAPAETEATGATEAAEATEAPAPPESEGPQVEEPEAKPKKAKKKQKKSTPAKIISLPEEPEEPAPEPKREAPVARKPSAPARKQPAAEPAMEAKTEADERKKGRKKRTVVEPEADEAAEKGKKGKKKSSFKRKEVVEGAALVDQRFGRGRKGGKKKGKAARVSAEHQTQITIPKAIKRRIKVDESIVLADLAKRMGVKANELIKQLMSMGIMVTVNQAVDFDTATLLAGEFNFEVERASFEEETILKTEEDAPENLQFRPPVVTIMGHVDHGKTSLLDVIRHAKVADSEAGGITQHIGAYHVPHETGSIVFLDTPGHEAFTAMRARGAQVTDIVVLVVAADDGVMPQTIEAIDHSRAAGVPIIVAVNKIDKPEADLERIKRELAEKGLVPEDWGGDTIFVNVSAKQKIGIDELLEMIVLQSEVLELKANPNKLARGYIIESRLETGRGPVASVLISEGTLHAGESVVSGMYYGKIRAMFNDRGEQVKEAGPSMPVEIIGLTGVPMAGDELITLTDEKDAKQVSEHRLQKQRSMELAKTTRMSLDSLYEQMLEGEVKDLNLIIKADVQGSIEALKDSLTRLSTNEVKINVMHSATGTIHESDVSLAAVSNAIILGFNVRPTGKVTQMAEEENVDIRYYNVIYNAIKEIKDAMLGMMASRFEERVLGRAEVREIFTVPHVGTIAGCMVIDGKIQRGQPIRLVRDGIVIHEGKIASLRRYKDDVKEVFQNYECGIGIEKFNDIKLNDIIECYYLEEIKPVME